MHIPNLLIVRFNDRRRQNIGYHQYQNQEKSQEIKTVNDAVGSNFASRPNEIVPVVNYRYLKQGQHRPGQRVKVDGSTIRQIVRIVVTMDLVALKHQQCNESPAENGGHAENNEAAEASE